jgi:hypothetical protein
MKQVGWAVSGVAAAGTGAAILIMACNAVLGITAATPESTDGAPPSNDAGDGIDVAPSLSCDYYCALVMHNCTDENLEWLDMQRCQTGCPIFEPGSTFATNTMDDTLGCRIWHAQAAATDPDYHCRHAGPVGGGICGNDCEAFCNLDTSYCTAPYPQAYSNMSTCEAACNDGAFPYLTGDAGDLAFASGDTLNCRIYHLEAAFLSGPAAQYHCPHTEPVSAVCFNGNGASDAGSD